MKFLRTAFLVAMCTLALPSLAVAVNDPDLTFPTGTLLGVSANLTATNIGIVKFTGTGGSAGGFNIECGIASLTGTLTKNSGTAVEETISAAQMGGTATGGDCTTSYGGSAFLNFKPEGSAASLPWCLRSVETMAADEAHIRGGACNEPSRKITFSVKLTEAESWASTCRYTRLAALTAAYLTHPEDAILTFSQQEFAKNEEENPVTCPTSFKLDMALTLERDAALKEPLYIS